MKKTLFLLAFLVCSTSSVLAQHFINTDSVSDDKKIIVSVSGGYSYRLEKVRSGYTSERRDHLKKLNWGYTYQASAYYMFNYRAGAGLEYNAYRASETMPGVHEVTAPNGQTGTSRISDDVTISFYGAGLFFNLLQESKHKIYFNASIGYLRYKNDTYYLGNYKITGGGLGTSVGLTYQYLIAKDFSIGPKLSFSGSSIRKFTTEGEGYNDSYKLHKDDAYHYTRIEAGAQLMYRF